MDPSGEEIGFRAEVAAIYRRSAVFVRMAPLVLLIPFAAEMVQHAAEIGLGMYADHPALSAADRNARASVGAVKSLAVAATVLFALRWWRFDGDYGRVLRPDFALVRGIAITLLVEIGGSSALQLGGFLIGMASRAAIGSVAWLIATIVPVILWSMISVLLFSWYVMLLTEQEAVGPQASIKATYPMWGRCFGLYLAATLPPMAVHYVLGYAAVGQSNTLIWLLMALDSIVVALMAVQFASVYYTIHLRTRS